MFDLWTWASAHPAVAILIGYFGIGLLGGISRVVTPGTLQARLDKNPFFHGVFGLMAAGGFDLAKIFAIVTGVFEALSKTKLAAQKDGGLRPPPSPPSSLGGGALAPVFVLLFGLAVSGAAATSCTRADINSALALGASAIVCVEQATEDDPAAIFARCSSQIAPDAAKLLMDFILNHLAAKRAAVCGNVGVHMLDGGVITLDDAGPVVVLPVSDAGAK